MSIELLAPPRRFGFARDRAGCVVSLSATPNSGQYISCAVLWPIPGSCRFAPSIAYRYLLSSLGKVIFFDFLLPFLLVAGKEADKAPDGNLLIACPPHF